MTRGRERIHLDATAPGQVTRRAACGWLCVDVETDISKVTCKSCLSRFAAKRPSAKTARTPAAQALSAEELQAQFAAHFRATLAPTAGPPPIITTQLWATSCKGGERRCGECEICQWEREAQLWAAVAPWNTRHMLTKPEGAPRWSSLSAALVAFAEFEKHDRCGPSALGGILDRVKRGATDAGGIAKPDDPLLRRAGELVRVRQAIELAYPDGQHGIPAPKCRALLLLRTPGVVVDMPSYEALSELFQVSIGELKALVRTGRKRVGDELSKRGIIPTPRSEYREAQAASSAQYGETG